MSYEVTVSTVRPRALAAVRRTVRPAEIPGVIQGLLGNVWRFLTDNAITSTGHNVAIYRPDAEGGAAPLLDAWFGVEVQQQIPPGVHVLTTATPAGLVAATVHWGEYARLGAAHDAVQAWCRANGRRMTGTCWEVYGDWSDDWAQVRTDVFYLLHE